MSRKAKNIRSVEIEGINSNADKQYKENSSNRKKTVKNKELSYGFALFTDSSSNIMEHCINSGINNKIKKSEKEERISSQRSEDDIKKSSIVKHGIEKDNDIVKKRNRRNKEVKDIFIAENNVNSDRKGRSSKRIGKGNKQVGEIVRQTKNDSTGIDRGTSEKAKEQWFGNGLKFKSFEDSSVLMEHKTILGKIKKINDNLCEIVMDGFRYKVSPWSIKDDVYIQGLDSNFLVTKYKTKKRKKE